MPHQPPTTQPPDIIITTAAQFHIPGAWAAAVAWNESEWTFGHVTPNDGGTGGTSWGVFQIHENTLDAMSDPWGRIQGIDLLNRRAGTEVGCAALRFNLWRVLEKRGLVRRDEHGRPQYKQMPGVLECLLPALRRQVLEHATAAFTCGDAGYLFWPKMEAFYGLRGKPELAAIKADYIANVMRDVDILEELQP